MLRSLYTNIILLVICIAALIVLITFALLPSGQSSNSSVAVDSSQKVTTITDPSKMDSVSYEKYVKMKEGESIFKDAGCITCHNVCSKKVGPALQGVSKRRKKEWIYQAVHNFSLLLESGDKDAKMLLEQFGTTMPTHAFLTNEDIDKIVNFIEYSNCNE